MVEIKQDQEINDLKSNRRGGKRPGAGRPNGKKALNQILALPRAPDQAWPADEVRRFPVKQLIPYAKNARKHSAEQIEQIAASIREWGWTNPVLMDEVGNVICGHGRILAAAKLQIAEIPVMIARGWSEAQKRAYILADNQLTLNGAWDNALLRDELTALKDLDFKIELLGFDQDTLASLLGTGGTVGLTDPDAAPQPPATPISASGDLWALGRHRLLCGDVTNVEDTQKVLADVEPHLMVTDPPYGVDYDPDWRNRADRANGKPYGDRAIGQVTNDDQADWRQAWLLFPGDVIYAWHPPGAKQVEHYAALCAAGFEVRMQIIWAKQQFPIGRGNYHVQHEPCWYAIRKGKTAHWQGDRTQSTLWSIAKPVKSETGHSTQKPIECMKRPILNNSSPGQAVYDPFVGSGTTIIAAEMTGRCCHAIEINPAYVDVAVQRWQNFTGGKAILDGDGRTFDEIACERRALSSEAQAMAAQTS